MKTSPRSNPTVSSGPLLWGVLGFGALLGSAIYRLTPYAVAPVRDGLLNWWQAGLYALSVLAMAYSEGYKGFQLQVSPRVVARGQHLARNPRLLHVILAPLFVMCLFHARRKRLIISWSLLVGIVMLVMIVRHLSQPWRGIVDSGVVVGLTWGLVAMLVYLVAGLRGREIEASAELPGD